MDRRHQPADATRGRGAGQVTMDLGDQRASSNIEDRRGIGLGDLLVRLVRAEVPPQHHQGDQHQDPQVPAESGSLRVLLVHRDKYTT